jgi:hypothetical protein
MENHVKGAVKARVENHAGSAVETRKEWIAPELKKVDIEEITAHGGIFSADGMGSS